MGSVKDLVTIERPTSTATGLGDFVFTDEYSVFDWGHMPDKIYGKGKSLCCTSAVLFKDLENARVKTHYISGGFDEAGAPTNTMRIRLVNVYKPERVVREGRVEYDYSKFREAGLTNFLIPLEILYRNGLPEGSSVFRRLRKGELTIQDLGLDHQPESGKVFSAPYFDVSTKFEDGDRYLGWMGAQEAIGLTDDGRERLRGICMSVNEAITKRAKAANLDNWDGKIEVDDLFMILDTLGTLDECRYTYRLNGRPLHVSKELLRQYYHLTQPEWEEAIKSYKDSGIENWRELVLKSVGGPKPLPRSLLEIVSNMYMSAANALIQTNAFSAAPTLDEVMREYERYMEALKQ